LKKSCFKSGKEVSQWFWDLSAGSYPLSYIENRETFRDKEKYKYFVGVLATLVTEAFSQLKEIELSPQYIESLGRRVVPELEKGILMVPASFSRILPPDTLQEW